MRWHEYVSSMCVGMSEVYMCAGAHKDQKYNPLVVIQFLILLMPAFVFLVNDDLFDVVKAFN